MSESSAQGDGPRRGGGRGNCLLKITKDIETPKRTVPWAIWPYRTVLHVYDVNVVLSKKKLFMRKDFISQGGDSENFAKLNFDSYIESVSYGCFFPTNEIQAPQNCNFQDADVVVAVEEANPATATDKSEQERRTTLNRWEG